MTTPAPLAGQPPATTTILLVEDDERVRGILRGRLESAGYAVVETASVDQAIQHYRAGPVDAVITDIVLPGRSGIELITELRREFPNARIVAMSGAFDSDVPALLRQSKQAGAIHGLPKPFTTEQLLDTVRAALMTDPIAAARAQVPEEPAHPLPRSLRWTVLAAVLAFGILVGLALGRALFRP